MNIEEFHKEMRVAYIPGHAYENGKYDPTHPDIEKGTVSSVSAKYVFVKFDKQLRKFGWEGTTSQSCCPEDLIAITPTTP